MNVVSSWAGGLAGYGCSAAAYLSFALLVASWSGRTLNGVLAAIAGLITCLWAAATAYELDAGAGWIGPLLEIARSGSWSILLLSLLHWLSPVQRSALSAAIVAFGTVVTVITLAFATAADQGAAAVAILGGHLALAVLGMALAENLFRNSPASRRWTIKYLCLGLGGLFTYDFFLYSDALLFRRMSTDLFLARGIADLMVAPLLVVYAYRAREEGAEIAVSRRIILHSATLLGAGLYLIGMGAAGYYVQRFDGAWSGFLQAVFLFAAILLFLVSMFSASFRASLRVLVEKNLLRAKFDYRAEWLRFIRTTSEGDRGNDLRIRVVQAVCDIMDSPEGGLWLARDPRTFALAASWNLSRWRLNDLEAKIEVDAPLSRFLERTRWIVDLDEFGERPNHYRDLAELPAFMRRIERIWLVIPLIHYERLFGMIMIGRSRATRVLSWEDFDLLKIVGRQAASYLAEQEASQQLAEARQFEDFNKRFAFIAHDIKNLGSQLSLIVSNSERHRGSEAFQRDAAETLRQSVDKLNRMLRQLQAPPSQNSNATVIALAPLLNDIVAKTCKLHPIVSLDIRAPQVSVAADEARLRAAIDHLVQNALDAVGCKGNVQIRLTDRDRMAVIEVEDDGPGMEPAFIREKLFRPFATTKDAGYGIGAYDSRNFATTLGGRLDVVSEPGKGTVMRMSLPIAGTT